MIGVLMAFGESDWFVISGMSGGQSMVSVALLITSIAMMVSGKTTRLLNLEFVRVKNYQWR